MAPTHAKMKTGNFPRKEGNWKKPQNQNAGVKKKKWVPENNFFQGSIQEGQGFAFERKEKVKHDYNKFLRKEKKKKTSTQVSSSSLYREQYPEHLKHLYMAEAEKLKNEAWTNRMNRIKLRKKGQGQEKPKEDGMEEKAASDQKGHGQEKPKEDGMEEKAASDQEGSGAPEAENTEMSASVAESLSLSNRMKKRLEKKTSFQRSLEECERVREIRRKKKEEFLERQQQREEAIRKYKERKMETYQMLCRKTKKGQPNLNLQMDYLLQKIQKISETAPKK